MFAAKNELLTTPSGGYRIPRSLRFRSSASAYLNRTPASAGNRTTWTWSGWVKRGSLGTSQYPFYAVSGTTEAGISFTPTNAIYFLIYNSGATVGQITTAAVFRDPSAWYHVVAVLDSSNATPADRMRLFVNGVRQTDNGTAVTLGSGVTGQINNNVPHYISTYNGSLYFFDGYLAEVNFIDGQALTPSSFGAFDTNGVWQPARYTGSYGTNGFYLPFTNTGNGQNILTYSQDFTNAIWLRTTGVTATGDTVAAPNGTTTADTITYAGGGTAGNYRIYYTSAGIAANGTVYTYSIWLRAASNVNLKLSGNFGSTADITVTSNWQRFSVTVTGNGVSTLQLLLYSPVGDNSAFTVYAWGAQLEIATTPGPYFPTTSAPQSQVNLLGADYSLGSSYGYNSWVPNNISLATGTTYDSMIDSPTNYADGGNGRGNYAVLNPLDKYSTNTVSNGNLATNGVGLIRSTFGMTSGKWYWEFIAQSALCLVGITTATANTAQYVGQNASGWGYYANGNKYTSGVPTAYGAAYTTNDIIGVAFDADNGTLTFYKNGTSQGTAFAGLTSGPYFAACGDNGSTAQPTAANFGQSPFSISSVPSGFSALNTQNLPTPTIAAGNKYFDATTYTGNSSNPRTFTGLGFQPDFIWLKRRSLGSSHLLLDAVRGFGLSKELSSNATLDEGNSTTNTAAYGSVTAATTDGFTVNTGSINADYVNTSSQTYVGWQWKGGNGTVSNTSGSITSTVSANTSAGFSVVTFTQPSASPWTATVGHGLGVAPSMIIYKDRSAVNNWLVYHSSLGATQYLYLSATNAAATGSNAFNNTAPTSTVFTTTAGSTFFGNSGATCVAYCFAPVAGYSAFGGFTANGVSGDGSFIYTGFLPRFILYKRTDSTSSWFIHDTSRQGYNVQGPELYPDSSAVEATATRLDILSNGFKIRAAAATNPNVSSATYIYACFASNPFKTSRAF